MFCTTQPWLKLSERRAHCTKKIRLLTDLWISTKKTSNTQVSTVSYPWYAVSTVTESFEKKREQTCPLFKIPVSHSTRLSTVQQSLCMLCMTRWNYFAMLD